MSTENVDDLLAGLIAAGNRTGGCGRPCPAPGPGGQPCTACQADQCWRGDHWSPTRGRGQYTARVDFPGGEIMLTGAQAPSRDAARRDLARLTGQPEPRVSISKLRRTRRRSLYQSGSRT
jgi:hypothetical protein